MTDEELAREWLNGWCPLIDLIARVRADEREKCAGVCERYYNMDGAELAAAIRERKEQG